MCDFIITKMNHVISKIKYIFCGGSSLAHHNTVHHCTDPGVFFTPHVVFITLVSTPETSIVKRTLGEAENIINLFILPAFNDCISLSCVELEDKCKLKMYRRKTLDL